ncbi:hypothetical protein [Alcanivorax sp. DG881]|uniref:hypothetical protein n=1 Tax=Alcanivorax sp. DG881 TaxID=236097 RepID=UPI0012E9C780|nr:hypothetical protein [Alcanivorax sp. DG881]
MEELVGDGANLSHYNYVAWIPCLSGNLVFDFIAPCLGQNHTHVPIFSKTKTNLIYSEKDWQDKPADLTGKTSILLRTEEHGEVLTGEILLAPSGKAAADWKVKLRHKNIQEKNSSQDFINSLPAQSRANVYVLAFSVHKSGITFLSTKKINTPDNEPQSASTLARQAFYFIKYCLHRHKHHPKSIDSITTTEEIFSDNDKRSPAKKIIDQLIRSLVELKRLYSDLGKSEGNRHIGLIAYTRSLAQIIKEHKLEKPEYCDSILIYLENFEKSFSAIRQERHEKSEKKSKSITLSLQITSFLLASFFAFTVISFNLHRLKPEKHHGEIEPYPELFTTFFSDYLNIYNWLFLTAGITLLIHIYFSGWFGKLNRVVVKSYFKQERFSYLRAAAHILGSFIIISASLWILFGRQ